MKHLLTFLVLLVMQVTASMADNNFGNFDPEKYNRELEAAITREAKLTPQEAQAFFPVYREMQNKLRELFNKGRELHHSCPVSEKDALAVIKGMDSNELEIKRVLQHYHARFLKVLPATKVLACIKAEERFNRNMMKDFARQVNERQKPSFRKKR